MMKSEKQFTLEIESFEKKMQMWNTPSVAVIPSSKTKQENGTNLSVPPEVKAFEVI